MKAPIINVADILLSILFTQAESMQFEYDREGKAFW